MPSKKFTPGKYIAYLSFVLESNHTLGDKLSPTDVERVGQINDLYHYLSHKDVENAVEIPDGRCPETLFLDGNDAFFITHLLIESPQETNYELLISHLNSCFGCFQIYSQFFKDYSAASEEIRRLFTG